MQATGAEVAVTFVAVEALRPTEEVDAAAVERLIATVARQGVWTHPILVEKTSLAILDGHHRYRAAQALGLKVVPSVMADYADARLELTSWRPDARVAAQDVLDAAAQGRLMPPKSTKHRLRMQLPRTALRIDALRRDDLDRRAAPVVGAPAKAEVVAGLHFEMTGGLGAAALGPSDFVIAAPEALAPHPLLRRLLSADPAMEALLPGARCRFTVGAAEDAPFRIRDRELIALGPHLLDDRRALAAAARWGLETHAALTEGDRPAPAALADAFAHGAALGAALSAEARALYLEGAPAAVASAMAQGAPSRAALAWFAERAPAALRPRGGLEGAEAGPSAGALASTTERVATAGGDGRLTLDPKTGLNRYGTAPRPRPEAVHFSSSTASSITDHGFLLCDLVRRAYAAAAREGVAEAALQAQAVDALAAALRGLVGLGAEAMDAAIAASGTDLELLTVALARAATPADRPLTNIQIAPEETGRGVALAAEGRFFDARTSTGAAVVKGAPAWPGADIETAAVAIRDPDGAPRSTAAMDRDLTIAVERAIARGRRVLAHALPASKTGLAGPSDAALARLQSRFAGAVDVAVDACQFRSPPAQLAAWVARGWLVQVTGSKFLTGPPFSGALLIPPAMRPRAPRVGALLAAAPAVGDPGDWSGPWRAGMAPAAAPRRANFGAVFRWLPAILEARLFEGLTDALKRDAFAAFHAAVADKLAETPRLRAIEAPAPAPADARSPWNASIVCFTVHPDGDDAPLDAEACARLFKVLNQDASALAPDRSPRERALLRRPAHIGQPVTVAAPGGGRRTFLRLVLGARFFNTVGYAEPSAADAALASEISDALRALEKLDLLAALWPRLNEAAERPDEQPGPRP